MFPVRNWSRELHRKESRNDSRVSAIIFCARSHLPTHAETRSNNKGNDTMKKTISLALVGVLTLLIATDLIAQDQIVFKKGSKTATVKGRIPATEVNGGYADYVVYRLTIEPKQEFTATISSSNGEVLFSNDKTSIGIRDFVEDEYETGNYLIHIHNPSISSDATYVIKVTLR